MHQCYKMQDCIWQRWAELKRHSSSLLEVTVKLYVANTVLQQVQRQGAQCGLNQTVTRREGIMIKVLTVYCKTDFVSLDMDNNSLKTVNVWSHI